MTVTKSKLRHWPLLPTLFVVGAVCAMIALGVWQLQRRTEKEALIALFERNIALLEEIAFPLQLPLADSALYRVSRVNCLEPVTWILRGGRDHQGRSGYRMIADCHVALAGQAPTAQASPTERAERTEHADEVRALIDVGTSESFEPPAWSGGTMRGRIVRGPDSPSLWERLTKRTTPVRALLIAEEAAPGLQPSALSSPRDLPNNHLFYAIQWFFFAVAAIVIYTLALRRRLRG